jgi:hypothetical protein
VVEPEVEPVSRRVWSIAFVAALLLPLVVGTALGARADGLALYITFHPGPQRITVTLADGTPVGTTSGTPTAIPAGLYNLFLDDSAAVEGPQFDLKGPGVNLVDSMFYGENPSETFTATFEPGSTYTWRNDEQPGVVFTFVTSSGAGSTTGGANGSGSTGTGPKVGKPSTDIVGSAVVPFRGALDAIVYKSGRLSLTRNGRPVKSLKTGRYTFSVDDESKTGGFSVQLLKGKPQTITGKAYVGNQDVTIRLKPGRWFYFTPAGKQTTFFVTS